MSFGKLIIIIALLICFIGACLLFCNMINKKGGIEAFTDESSTNSDDTDVENTETTGETSNVSSSGDYNNYNHYTGSSTPTVYYGPNGTTAKMLNQKKLSMSDS